MSPMQLQVGIVGAGIGGLGAAISLIRAGHAVELFERSEFKDETGAAITMTHNAHRVLEHWGFDSEKARVTNLTEARFHDWETGKLGKTKRFGDEVEKLGGKYTSYHRVDLHEHLKEIAVEAGVKITLATKIVELDCENAVLHEESGRLIQKDMIVIADGINSRLISSILPGPNPGRLQTGKSIFRTLIPLSSITSNPLTSPLFASLPCAYVTTTPTPTQRVLLSYPCRANTVLSVGLVFSADRGAHREWDKQVPHSDLMAQSDEFPEAWRAILEMATDVRVYSMDVRRSLDSWTKGKAVVIGDAAHGMFPVFAQGGAMAIEDSGAFEAIFKNMQSREQVEGLLGVFEKVRLPRANAVQVLSNTGLPTENEYLQALSEDRDESVRRFWKREFPEDKTQWSPEICKFLYGYDVLRESEEAAEEWKARRDGRSDSLEVEQGKKGMLSSQVGITA